MFWKMATAAGSRHVCYKAEPMHARRNLCIHAPSDGKHTHTHTHTLARSKCAEQQNDRLREEMLQTQHQNTRLREQCAASDRDAIEAKAALAQMREEVAAAQVVKKDLAQVHGQTLLPPVF